MQQQQQQLPLPAAGSPAGALNAWHGSWTAWLTNTTTTALLNQIACGN